MRNWGGGGGSNIYFFEVFFDKIDDKKNDI